MKVVKRIYAIVDSHTFSLFAMRVKNEGLTMGTVLSNLIKMYNNGEVSSKKESKVKDRFSYIKEINHE